MKSQTLYVLIGLPASGKTTWAREWVNEKPKERVRVNRDDIRRMLGPYWVPQREDLVTDIEDSMITDALSLHFDVVVDSTNLRGTDRFKQLIFEGEILEWFNDVQIKVKDFRDVPVETCIERDAKREEGHVGEDVIRKMANKYGLS